MSLVLKSRFLTKAVFLLCFIGAFGQVSAGSIQHRIIGGKPVEGIKYPWTVSLINTQDNEHFCAGSLIAPEWVITAAHCIQGAGPKGIDVFIGGNSLDRRGQGEVIPAIGFFSHPEYKDDHDIALLKLSRVTKKGSPIRLVSKALDDSLPENTDLIVTGWGLTSTDSDAQGSNELMEVTVPLRNRQECKANYKNTDGTDITDNMICAGGIFKATDSCSGDSGGPLFVRDNQADGFQLLGIVSFGSSKGCANKDHPGVYTRVSRYHDWIKSIREGLLPLVSQLKLGYVGESMVASQVLTLVNNGSTGKLVQGVSIVGNDAFKISTDECSDKVLSKNQTCNVMVSLQSSAVGDKSGSVLLSISDADTIKVPLRAEVIGRSNELGLALDAANLTWFSGGDLAWASQSDDKAVGGSLARSGAITHDQKTVMLTQITGPGELSFKWSSSTEEHFDRVVLMVDGRVITSINGEQETQTVTRRIESGKHIVAWGYHKDGSDPFETVKHYASVDAVEFRKDVQSKGSSSSSGGGSMSLFALLGLLGLSLLQKISSIPVATKRLY